MPRIPHEAFYLKAFQKHGISAQALCWIDKKRQILRFAKLLEALQNDINNLTIVDAGCGFGDLYLFMQEQNRLPKRYIGIETLKDFATIAKKQTNQEILHLDIINDPLPQADFYLCSGALNTLHPFETQLFLQKCFEASKKGAVFNFLYGKKESAVYNYINNSRLQTILKHLNAKVFFDRSGYLPNDRTVGICAQSLE